MALDKYLPAVPAHHQKHAGFIGLIFKGALEGRASAITEEMKLAAAEAIAGLVDGRDLNDENILPEAFDPRVADVVSSAVKDHIRK